MGLNIKIDVPQQLIDVFNKVDFKKTSSLVMIGVRTKLSSWAKENLPKKTAGKKYFARTGQENKKLAPDFPQNIMDIMNEYDWNAVPLDSLNKICQYLYGSMSQFVTMKK